MGVLILGCEIKIGAGGCELFVVDLEGEEGVCVYVEEGEGVWDRKWTPLSYYLLAIQRRENDGDRWKVFNQRRAVPLMWKCQRCTSALQRVKSAGVLR